MWLPTYLLKAVTPGLIKVEYKPITAFKTITQPNIQYTYCTTSGFSYRCWSLLGQQADMFERTRPNLVYMVSEMGPVPLSEIIIL